jgi:hypothetical protein
LGQLERIVTAYLELAESMALRKIPMTMSDWEERLNRFIELTDFEVLRDAGRVTAELAKEFAETEFEKYRVVQDRLFSSDFDRFLQKADIEDLARGTDTTDGDSAEGIKYDEVFNATK